MASASRTAKSLEHRFREFLAYSGNQDTIEIAVAVDLYLANPEQGHKGAFKRAMRILRYQDEVLPVIEVLPQKPGRATITFADPGGGEVVMRLQEEAHRCVLRSTRSKLSDRRECGREFMRLMTQPAYLRMIAARRGRWKQD